MYTASGNWPSVTGQFIHHAILVDGIPAIKMLGTHSISLSFGPMMNFKLLHWISMKSKLKWLIKIIKRWSTKYTLWCPLSGVLSTLTQFLLEAGLFSFLFKSIIRNLSSINAIMSNVSSNLSSMFLLVKIEHVNKNNVKQVKSWKKHTNCQLHTEGKQMLSKSISDKVKGKKKLKKEESLYKANSLDSWTQFTHCV